MRLGDQALPGWRWPVAAALVLALAARLGLALLHEPPPPTGDVWDFLRHAEFLADRGGYPPSLVTVEEGPSAFRPPAYPYVLAGILELAGPGDAPRVFGALLGTLAVALLGLVAARLFDRRTAVVAMLIAAVFPPLVMISVAQLSEGLFIALVLGSLAAVLQGRDRLGWVLIAGALAGGAALTRTNGLVILLPLVLAATGWRPRLALLAAAVVVIAPWSIRSSTQLDGFVPLTTQPGFVFAGTYNDESRTDEHHPAAWRIPDMEPYIGLRRPGLDEAELERKYRAEAFGYAREHPTYPFVVMAWATARMLNVADFERHVASSHQAGVGRRYAHLNRYALWAVGLLALAGAFTAAARAASRWLWLFPLLLWLSAAITIGSTRFRTPLDPFFILLAAAALVALSRRVEASGVKVLPWG
jgi:4-amino-4-deoxy-L-arabinose transferase-like glycosyltransferase